LKKNRWFCGAFDTEGGGLDAEIVGGGGSVKQESQLIAGREVNHGTQVMEKERGGEVTPAN